MKKKLYINEEENVYQNIGKSLVDDIKGKLTPVADFIKKIKEKKSNDVSDEDEKITESLNEEINRIKSLFGQKLEKKIINEQREIIIRRAFDLDFATLDRTAQLAKVRRYMEDIERAGSIFDTRNPANPFPYENIGWRSFNDFISDINTNVTAEDGISRAREIERVLTRLNPADRAKFDIKVKSNAKTILDRELARPDSELHIQVEQSIRDILNETVEAMREADPNVNTQELREIVNSRYLEIKEALKTEIGDQTVHFDNIPTDINLEIDSNPDIENAPIKPELRDNLWVKISDAGLLRIRNVFAELRKLSLGVDVEANINDTLRQLEYFERYDLSREQKRRILERIRQNISSVISGDIADAANFKQALQRVESAIDALDLPADTKTKLKQELRTKMTLNWFGSTVGEPYDWVNVTEEEINAAHYGDKENTLAKLQTRFTGNPPGTELSMDYVKKFGLNAGKRAMMMFMAGQFRTFEEIGKDTRMNRGGTRARYWKTYLTMLFIKFIALPLVELLWNAPLAYQSCARYSSRKKIALDAIEEAGGDEVDKANLEKAMPIPSVCAELENGNWVQNLITVYKNEANSLPAQIGSLLEANGQGNWLGTEKDWAITVENIFDLINPLSTRFDDIISQGFDYEKYKEWNKQYDDEVQKVLEDINNRKEDAKREIEKVKEQVRNLYAEDIKNKQVAKEFIDKYFVSPNFIPVDRQESIEFDYVKNNMDYDPFEKKWYIPYPNDPQSKIYFGGNMNDGYYANLNGEELRPKEWSKVLDEVKNKIDSGNAPIDQSGPRNESIKKLTKKIIMEDSGKKFGEDNFKHWKDTFTFKSEDEKNPGQYKEVKINMEDVMDRIDHFRKKYDEDDAFVRAVIDTHEDVVKIMYTKGLADIRESATPRGLALVLRTLNESRGEMEIFSVARPANGNWFLVKGDYTQSQLANMDLEKKEPEDKEKKREVSGSEELKKKEERAINVLKSNEKEGLDDLPRKVREKVLEKMGRGWTTETPPSFLNKLIEKSQINTIFNDKIEIFKLDSNEDTFDAIVDNSSQIFIKRGFCRSLYMASDKANLDEKQEKVINHILEKCDRKFGGKLGVRNF